MALLSQKLDQMITSMMQREAKAEERKAALLARIDNCSNIMQLATSRMNDLTTAIMQREDEADNRNYYRSLVLRLACGPAPVEARFNWMFGHGVTPRIHGRATKSQARFDRLKVNLNKFAIWFTDNATDEQLSKAWIQFNDTPRVVISGLEIKDVLMNDVDMSAVMESAMVRVLRRDEGHREVNSHGSCHYVGEEWANKVVEPDSNSAECEELFHLKPKMQYSLAGCKKVVASLDMKEDGWAALSIDLILGVTYLIHPRLSGMSTAAVLQHHLPLMQKLTSAAQSHMVKLVNAVLPDTEWDYQIALQGQHHMNGCAFWLPFFHIATDPYCHLRTDWPESGFCTAFYSVPKDNQFLIVSSDTISLAKLTFLYSLVRMSYPNTKNKMPQGKKKKVLKRDIRGKFLAHGFALGGVAVEAGQCSRSEAGSAT